MADDHDVEARGATRATFLVVEDDPAVRKLISTALTRLDPGEILEVEDGLEAQRILSKRSVDVVVTDVLMPKMDGRELMKWAREHRPEPRWIVLSGLDTFDTAVNALHLGAFDFLAKPLNIGRLQVAVRNAVEQIELARDRERLYRELALSNAQLAEKVDHLAKLCRMLEEQSEVIQGDIARAEVIQRALLPRHPPEIDGWCVETLYRPGNNIGGDLYDIVQLDDRHLGVVIADAAGHGVAAAMLSVLFKHHLELVDERRVPRMPGAVLAHVNRRLHADMSTPGAFITAAYLLLDRHSGHLRVASAGHPPCIWAGSDGRSRLLERTGPALGIEADARYHEVSVELAPGDRLLLYTDGALDGGFASHDELMQPLVHRQEDRAELLSTIHAVATRKLVHERDDISLILLEHCAGESHFDDAAPPRSSHEPMPPPPAAVQMLQGTAGTRAFMSIAGTGTWTRSQAFLDAALRLLRRKRTLTIDLGACEYLDSTFLGTLNEIVTSRLDAVRLQRVPASIRALFEELCMTSVLNHASLITEALPERMEPVSGAAVDATQQGWRMLKAHEILSSLSDENQAQFQGVVESLRTDLEAAHGHRH